MQPHRRNDAEIRSKLRLLTGGLHEFASEPLARAAEWSAAKPSNVTLVTLRCPASATIDDQRAGGMRPLFSQLQTTEDSTPSPFATAEVPPRAEMTESTSIGKNNSHHVSRSILTHRALILPVARGQIRAMAEPFEDIGNRLVQMRKALGIRQVDICRTIDIESNRYGQYEKGKRRITVDVAIKLAKTYGVTLDWIYLADPSALPQKLHLQLSRAA